MTDPAEDERILGDLPELPDHVWTAALGHAFDPQAEPDMDLVPTDDLTGWDAAYDTGLDDPSDDGGHDPLDAIHDPFDYSYDGDDTSGYDPGHSDYGYDNPGLGDTDGYF